MTRTLVFFWTLMFVGYINALGQDEDQKIAVGESLKDYIKENHIDEIENMVHQFANSKVFLEFLLEQGHQVDPQNAEIKKRDIRVGEDLDVFVKHFSEHQNFSMILVPIDIYSELIYDTLLFSVMEVSDEWLRQKYRYHDLTDRSVKEKLLSLENHEMLAEHMYHQGREAQEIGVGEVEVELNEAYISSNSIHMHMSELTRKEKKEFRNSWSIMKKAFSHDIDLNVEMNIYVFGTDDMRLLYYSKGQAYEYRITPGNIFKRHIFEED